MSKKEIKSEMFVCMFDKTRYEIMSLLISGVPDLIYQEIIKDTDINEFFEEISKKGHERGWCLDPECKERKD